MTAIALANAAQWNLAKAAGCRNKRDAERYRANAQQCLERLKELS